ncbi:hypothetical protein ACHAW6_011972 [Cyclotella cf. meneghiniana]
MNSSFHNTNRGYDIPPPTAPPPRPHLGDLGSLCPPPPPPPTPNTNGSHSQFQPMPFMRIQYQQSVTSCHQNYVPTTGSYQMQYQFPQNFQQPTHQAYPQYSNFLSPPPPPPPPPPPLQPPPWISAKHSMQIMDERHYVRQTHKNNTHDRNTIATPKGVQSDKTEDAKAVKKINPKMAKKYSGRGLKTITISGPGMPTQKFKICVGNHPDDVKKWIEERRKRFPRVGANRKSEYGSSEYSTSGHTSAVTTERKRGREEEFCGVNGVLKKQCTEKLSSDGIIEDVATGGGVLSSLLSGYDTSSSQEESGTAHIEPHGLSTKEEGTLNASSTNKSREMKSATFLSQNIEAGSATLSASPKGPTRICRYFKRGNCRHGNSCKFLHAKSDGNTAEMDRDSKRKAQSEKDKASRKYECELQALGLATPGQAHRNGHQRVGQFVNSTSLLNKLLQRDRERERRLTLQLLRYIVDCDYFQSGANVVGLLDDVTSDDHFETNGQPVTDNNGNPDSIDPESIAITKEEG